MTGRPSDFSEAMADAICDRLSAGESLRTICADDGFPSRTTVFRWLADPARAVFRDQYTRAREAMVDAMAEEILDISDDSQRDTVTDEEGNERVQHEVVQRSRLRVDTRKWLMSKLAPKKYGDKLELGGSIGFRHEDALDELEAEDNGAGAPNTPSAEG